MSRVGISCVVNKRLKLSKLSGSKSNKFSSKFSSYPTTLYSPSSFGGLKILFPIKPSQEAYVYVKSDAALKPKISYKSCALL